MFSALFRRAQITVDNAIGHAINRVIVAIPFVVAAGFATAALSVRLVRELGPEFGLAAMAGLYAILGLICAAFILPSSSLPSDGVEQSEVAEPSVAATSAEAEADPAASAVDRELVAAALTTVAPMALPALLRLLLNNLPLVTALAALVFIFTREKSVEEPAATS